MKFLIWSSSFLNKAGKMLFASLSFCEYIWRFTNEQRILKVSKLYNIIKRYFEIVLNGQKNFIQAFEVGKYRIM